MTVPYLITLSPRLAAVFMAAVALSIFSLPTACKAQAPAKVLTGQDAFTDYTKEHPGVRRHLTVADLPAPYATESANNHPTAGAATRGCMAASSCGVQGHALRRRLH